jgi:hypothetical protein
MANNVNPLNNVHTEDMILFTEIAAAMRSVAREYRLPLLSVTHHPDPEKGIDRLGDCDARGNIRLILRFKENGKWSEPRREEDAWGTAAHELAHLRHFNHGAEFLAFEQEMRAAMRNRNAEKKDHKAKVIDKLVKLQASRESEAAIGNTAAAEAFAAMINKMMLENELNPTQLDYARAADNDPVIEVRADLDKYGIEKKQTRVAWQEELARTVARAHLCTFLIAPGRNTIWFVGTKSHATVAEYVYGVLVPAANTMSLKARNEYSTARKREGYKNAGPGYREAWLDAFVGRINERFEESRKAALAAMPTPPADAPGTEQTGLMRLDGAMQKVRKYVDAKFSSGRGVAALHRGSAVHTAGSAAGRAAADAMTMGRKGVTSGVKGLLGK